MKLIAGPCVIEGASWLLDTAGEVIRQVSALGWHHEDFYFKSSFDKANRTSASSFRGTEDGLSALLAVRDTFGCKVLTDVHEVAQVKDAASVCDALQIPAFLCRQTDLIRAAVETGLPVNIKKGQFLSPNEALQVYDKAISFSRPAGASELLGDIWLCERGTFFGYNRLVVDIPGVVKMAGRAPVIFDCTHSVQRPGGEGHKSGGDRWAVPYLARAVAATGKVAGYFIETHPNPKQAKSDAATQIPIRALYELLEEILEVEEISR